MSEKQLLKVVGTVVTDRNGALESTTGRGIVQLKRGDTIVEFMKRFLADRGIVRCTLNQRSANMWTTTPIMVLNEEPKIVITYVFTQFPLSEIGYYGKDLTKAEMVRDFKFLKRILT